MPWSITTRRSKSRAPSSETSSTSTVSAAPLLNSLKKHHHASADEDEDDDNDDECEHLGALYGDSQRVRRQSRTIRVLVGLLILQAGLSLGLVVLWWRERLAMPPVPQLAYSPAYEAVVYTTKRFGRNESFYNDDETSPELDEAWNYLVGPSAGQIQLPADQARNLAPTMEMPHRLGMYKYGVAVFHQLHCLDYLRRSFHPEHYFTHLTTAENSKHKNHCLDYLRQSIMCSGDVTLDHWFNYTFTEPSFDPALAQTPNPALNWQDALSPAYQEMTPAARAEASELQWDTVHQCRNYNTLRTWLEKYQMVDAVYLASLDNSH